VVVLGFLARRRVLLLFIGRRGRFVVAPRMNSESTKQSDPAGGTVEAPPVTPSTLREKAVRGVVWSSIQQGGSNVISLAVMAVLIRLLAPELFGLLALASAFTALMTIFLNQGLTQAIVQREKLEPEHLDSAFWINVCGGVLLAASGMLAAGAVAWAYDEPRLTAIVRWLSLSFVIGALSSTQQAILRRRLAFRTLALRSLLAQLAGGGVGIGMALAGCGVWSLVGQILVMHGVGAVVLWAACDWRPRPAISRTHVAELWAFGISVLGTQVLSFLSQRCMDLLIGYFLGLTTLGYFSVARELLRRIGQVLTQSFLGVSLPTFARLQEKRDQLREAFCTASLVVSAIAFPAFIGVAVLTEDIVLVFFGPKWQPSIPLIQVLAGLGILQSVTFFNAALMMACGKPSWALGINALSVAVNLVAFFVALPWGIVAVTAAFTLRAYAIAPVGFVLVRKLIGLGVAANLRRYALPLLATLIMALVVLGTRRALDQFVPSNIHLGVSVVVGAVAYLLMIKRVAPSLAHRARELIRLAVSGRTNK
jgi:PST family polysaccharide transporter